MSAPAPTGGPDPTGERVERLLALQEIADVLARYCRGVDRLDRDLVRSCYHPDATDEHGSFSGDVEAYLDWVWGLLGRYDRTFHFLGNRLVEFVAPGTAHVETYGVAHHRAAGGRASDNLVTGFRFLDRFEQRLPGGPWLIARRRGITEWSRVDDEAGWWAVPDHLPQGRRDRSDPLYGPW